MNLDIVARINLELTETMRSKDRRGSLLWVIDKTKTAMGRRLIRQWMEQPLLDYNMLIKRQDAVDELVRNSIDRSELSELFMRVHDIERLMTRIVYGTANPKELNSLAYTLSQMPDIKDVLSKCSSGLLRQLNDYISPHTDIYELIFAAIKDNPASSVKLSLIHI